MPLFPSPPALAAELVTCLRFYSRLPLPALPVEAAHPPHPFARCLAWAPMAGAVLGGLGAAALLGAGALGLPPLLAAALALLATVLASGGLHEDGLADVADGFGGGRTPERRLEIMRDSRIGAYGALALGLSLLLRAAALEALMQRGGAWFAAAALVASASSSRGFGLLPLALLPPARADGLGARAGRLPAGAFAIACTLSVVLGLSIASAAHASLARAALALALAAAAAAGTARLALSRIGGFTGDVAGACQQACEVAFLIGLLVAPGAA